MLCLYLVWINCYHIYISIFRRPKGKNALATYNFARNGHYFAQYSGRTCSWGAFGGVAAGIPEASITAAVILAIGIGIQNFPEGIAVSMPLKRMGMSNKSFMYGQSSALVEPIAGVAGALAVNFLLPSCHTHWHLQQAQ